MIYDVAVIGAGVIGCMAARELSTLDASVCVIEAEEDVAAGASRANSGIVHAGFDAVPGTLKAKMNVAGCAMMKTTAEELGVPYKNCGSLVAAFSEEDESSLEELVRRAEINGVRVEMLSGQQVREMEPYLSDKVTRALFAPDAGIVCPFSLTIAAAENAAANGACFYLGSRVTSITRQSSLFVITAGEHTIEARFIVNAAGAFADQISAMAGGEVFGLRARKGEYVVFDTAMPAKTTAVIFGAPNEKGKGVLAAPTTDGNMLAGPTSEFLDDKDDKSTSREGLESALAGARRLMPGLETRYAIAVFAGLRAVPEGYDFIIELSKSAPGLLNLAGIESPGLTSAPAVARRAAELLFEAGLTNKPKKGAVRQRRPIERFEEASDGRKKEMIRENPAYANVVCRCRYVTEAEVIESITRPCGARTLDAVKFRTGAGLGRCHGGFCLPRISEILARETGKDLDGITKSGDGSYILAGRTK